jgi:hypothetical protein
MGPRLIVPASQVWRPLEGHSASEMLAQNADPLGALQRGEVPAIILRNAVPTNALNALGRRSLRFGQDATTAEGGFGVRNPYVTKARCALCALGRCHCDWRAAPGSTAWSWKKGNQTHMAALQAREAFELLRCNATKLPVCTDSFSREMFSIRSNSTYNMCERHRVYREYGRKLLHVFFLNKAQKHVQTFMQHAQSVRDAMRLMSERDGCRRTNPFCTPQEALMHSLRQLIGGTREVIPAKEPSGSEYVTGVLRVMAANFSYPEHFDSIFSNAWPMLRQQRCPLDAQPREVTEWGSINVDAYAPLQRNSFSPAAILTLQAPLRDRNPYDVRMYRVRWPALLFNCSVRLAAIHGVGARFNSVNLTDGREIGTSTLPNAAREEPVDLVGNPGDLYVFNSEFVHRTPRIEGGRERIVMGAVVGLGSGKRRAEVWS